MSEKQIAFLDELQALFDKYSIDEMCAKDEKTPIEFRSRGQILEFHYFTDNRFCDVRTFYGDHANTKRKGVNNGNG